MVLFPQANLRSEVSDENKRRLVERFRIPDRFLLDSYWIRTPQDHGWHKLRFDELVAGVVSQVHYAWLCPFCLHLPLRAARGNWRIFCDDCDVRVRPAADTPTSIEVRPLQRPKSALAVFDLKTGQCTELENEAAFSNLARQALRLQAVAKL